jgi:hypothetical protein
MALTAILDYLEKRDNDVLKKRCGEKLTKNGNHHCSGEVIH